MMRRLNLIFLAAGAVASTAMADENRVFPGDADFLANAYEAAETGTDFSYARQWGPGRAYDGTDTSKYYTQLVTQADKRRAQETSQMRRSNLITRAAAPAKTSTKARPALRGRLTD